MPSLPPLLARASRSLMFWLFVLVLVAAALRTAFPVGGYDEVRTGGEPIELAVADDGVWVLNFADLTVSLIRPSDEEVLLTAEVGEGLAPTLAANDDGAFVILDEGQTVARVDPGSGEVVDPVDVSGAFDDKAQDLAAGDGFVWVTSALGAQMVRIDTDTGEVDDTVDLERAASQPQIVGDALWVNEPDGLGEFDADTGEARRVVESSRQIRDYEVTEDGLWILGDVDEEDETALVLRLDPVDGTESDRVELTDTVPTHLAVLGDQVFVAGSEGRLMELNAAPLALLATEKVARSDKDLRDVVVAEDVVWVADGTNGIVHRPIDGIGGIRTDVTLR